MRFKLRQLTHAKRCEANHEMTRGAQLQQQTRDNIAVPRALNATHDTRRIARNRLNFTLKKGLKTRRTRGEESELHARFMRWPMQIR